MQSDYQPPTVGGLLQGEALGISAPIRNNKEAIRMKFALTALVIIVSGLLISYLRAYFFQEKPAKEPQKTVNATVASKEVKSGTHRSGRSKGGYSYTITFLTDDNQRLDLFAYELEFGKLKEGMTGMLTYKGRYFVDFK